MSWFGARLGWFGGTLLLLTGIGVLLSAAGRSSAAETVVSLLPASQSVKTGSQVEVSVEAENVTNLAAYEFRLSYNPDVLTYLGFEDAGYLGSTGRQVSCPVPVVEEGSVLLGCGTLKPSPEGPTGSGVLAKVKFRAVGAGTSPIVFTKVALANPEAIDCCGEPVVREAAVTVSASGKAPPPPTPTPNRQLRVQRPAQGAPTPPYYSLTDQPTPGSATGAEGAATTGSATPADGAPGPTAGQGQFPRTAQGGETSGTTFPVGGSGPPETDGAPWATPLGFSLAFLGMLLLAAVGAARRLQGGTPSSGRENSKGS